MEIVWIGLIVGFLLGFVIQRGFYCFYSALSNAFLSKDYRLIKATIWAFLVTMIFFHTLHTFGVQPLNPKTFFLAGSIIGAVVFGIGMVLAGSCIVGTPLRAWRGHVGYMIALAGMGIGGWLTIWGPLKPIREFLQKPTEVLLGGKVATLDRLLGVNHWILVAVVAALLIWWLFKLRGKESSEEIPIVEEKSSFWNKFFKKLWTPAWIGIGLGVTEIIAFASGKSPAGLGGFIKGYGFYFRSLLGGELPLGWPVMEVTGIMIGAVVAAVLANQFRLVWPSLKKVPRLFFGGLFMGAGAVTAVGGCNVAHLISHVPQFSIGSMVSMAFIISTTYLMLYLEFGGKKSD